GISFQEKKAQQGVSPGVIFGLSLLFVFLILAALYESWTLPFSVLLSTPVAVFGAFVVLWLRRMLISAFYPPYMVQIESDVYSQIGLVMLIGLAAKNAILIVEFAKDEHDKGKPLVDAALEGARLRLRPILMTSLIFISGCAVGPNYKKPAINTPTVYRGLTPDEAGKTDAKSLADEKWWDVFQDDQLKELIKTALQQNYDVRRAASRVLQAQALLGITRADQFPTVSGEAAALNLRNSRQGIFPAIDTNTNRVGLAFDWELDFWGKFRRATESARASLLATEWAQREIITELIANLTGAYFQLRALDLQLDISRR